jgi:hypothetical protein
MEGTMKRTWVAAMVVVVALCVVASACGGDGSDAKDKGTAAYNQDQRNNPPVSSYVGLTKKEAIAKAESENRQWRVLREDDETFMATQDYVRTRINFEIDKGKVTKATYG